MSKTLEGLTCRPLWVSHLGCLKGCLDYLEMGISDAWLYGITGHAFITNIAHDVCPSGPTAWCCKPLFQLGQNAGFTVDTVFARSSDPDFPEQQLHAWTKIRTAIDEGYPCYGWDLKKPEYYALIGYDTTGYRFHGHGADASTPTHPWNTLGTSETGLLTVHTVKPGRTIDDDLAVHQALTFAVQFARTRQYLLNDTYTSGPQAFLIWANALETGQANGFGVAYNAAVWAECRKYAVEFLKTIVARGLYPKSHIHPIRQACETAHTALQTLSELFPFFGHRPNHITDPRRLRQAIPLLHQIHDAEETAISQLQLITEETQPPTPQKPNTQSTTNPQKTTSPRTEPAPMPS